LTFHAVELVALFMARLIMRRGPSVGMIYHLNGEVVTIGRGSKNDIIIHDNEISREHCRLIRTGDDYALEDLGSSNGSFVNAQRVAQTWLLKHGAYVELGDAVAFEYERLDKGAAPADQTSPAIDTETALPLPVQDETPEHFSLLMASGPETGRVYTLTQPIIKIGRDLSNDIVIQDPEVSRLHARLRRVGSQYHIEDLGSTNGTRLNDVLVTESVPLQNDDTLFLGTSVHLQYMTASTALPYDTSAAATPQFPQDLRDYFTETQHIVLDTAPPRPKGTTSLGTGLEPSALADHIFLAYSREDWERFVAGLTVNLQDAGLNVWVEQYLTPGGADWREAVDQALQECWLMVIVMSPRSLALNHLKMAYRYFLSHDKPVIPLVYEPMVTLPIELARQRIILHDRKNPRRSVDKLIYEIKEMRK
jgi:pSer/pThr/pTyr-binding forkhead associated (FHA) protein